MRLKPALLILQFNFSLILFFVFFPALVGHTAFAHLSALAYQAFNPFCHQLAGRSFHVNGIQLAVCARCTGVYLGLFLGGVLFLALDKPMPKALLAFVVLLVVDGLLNSLGVVDTPAWARFGTGVFAGLSGGWLLGFGVSDLEQMLNNPEWTGWKTGNIT
jgi:uncharacterized membrane protein